LGGGGLEKKIAIIVLVKSRWNHHNTPDFQHMFSGRIWLSLVTFIEYDVQESAFLSKESGVVGFKVLLLWLPQSHMKTTIKKMAVTGHNFLPWIG